MPLTSRRDFPLWALAFAIFLHTAVVAGLWLADRFNSPEDFSGAHEIPVEMVAPDGEAEPAGKSEAPAASEAPAPAQSASARPESKGSPAEQGRVLERPTETDLPQRAGARGSRSPEKGEGGPDKPFGALAPLTSEGDSPKGPTFLSGSAVMEPRKKPGGGETGNDNYRAKVLQQVQDAMIDPGRPRPKAVALVAFSVDDSGGLASITLAKDSGHPELDAEALDMVRRAAPFPPPPANADRRFGAFIEFGAE